MSDYIIETLDPKRHCRESFDCGVKVLNTYLKLRANQEQKKRLSVTYVLSEVSDIIGYYTLSNSLLQADLVRHQFKHIPASYDIPAIKLGRLAVDYRHQARQIGRYLLKDAFTRTLEVASLSAVKCIEVVAKDAKASAFYQKFGFIPVDPASSLLFLPIETLLKTQFKT